MYTGLINFHYAPLTEDGEGGTVYGTPKKLGAAISLSETPTSNFTTLYAENGASETAATNGPTTAEVGVKDLTPEVMADLLGQTLDSNGVLKQSRADRAPYVALGFQMTSESEKDAFVWLYKGKFGRPTRSANTKGETAEFQTPVISATFIARDSDGQEKASIVQSETNGAITNAWFDEVYEEAPGA